MKQAVIAPSMLALLYPLDEEIPGYAQEQFEADLVGECEKDVRQALAAGAARVSVYFTEGRLATRNHHLNPWTGRNMLPHFIELNNRVMDRFTARERLGSTDDCGFSPFSIDEKPSHGSPDFARETAWQKITNRVAGTKLAAEKLGIG